MSKSNRAWRVFSAVCALTLLLSSPLAGSIKPAFAASLLLSSAQSAQPAPELAQAVLQAISADASFSRSDSYAWQIVRASLSNDQTQAVVLLALVDPANGAMLPSEPLTVVASHLPAGQWQVALPGQVDYISSLKSLPQELHDPAFQSELTSTATTQPESVSGAPFGGYYLPWANAASEGLSQGASHDTCGTQHYCTYAFDFYSIAADPKFPILAAKGGTVYTFYDSCTDRPQSEINPGNCTNYMVLQDLSTTPVTYQIYLHLSRDTIPAQFQQVGVAVQQGDFIANADNTGYSYGSHLHFMVVTTILNVGSPQPSYPWGYSVDITFKDVSINWDAATQGGRPCTATDVTFTKTTGYGKCVQSQNYYVSGNRVVNSPTGGLILPDGFQTLTDPSLLVGGWASDALGVTRMAMIAFYNGAWHAIDPAQTTSPFAFNLDLCAAGIPDGPFDLALRAWNKAGNQSPPLDVRHLVKSIPACPNLPPPPVVTANCADPTDSQVVLFSQPNYGGDCLVLNKDFKGYLTGLIPAVSSLKVGSSAKGELYRWGSAGSRRATFASSDRNLADNLINISANYAVVDTAIGGFEDILFPVSILGPAGADLTSVDSVVLAWDHGIGAAAFHALLFQGIYTDNSVCTVTPSTPYRTLDWQDGLTWPVGSLPAGDYGLCVQGKFDNGNTLRLSSWYFKAFTVSLGTLPVGTPLSTPYSDTMESGANGWTATGLWNLAADPANAANHTWVFNNGADYTAADPARGDLTSPPITLPGTGTQYLRFSYTYQTESPAPYYDQRWVQVSQNDGPFQNLLQLSDDATGAWLASPFISLAAYTGSTIRLRFHFDAIDGFNNTYSGWMVDNVTVNSTPPPTCSPATPHHTPASAASIAYGAAVSAAICPPGSADYYQFQGTKGDVVLMAVDAQSLSPSSPLDSLLTVYLLPDASSVIAENDNISAATSDSFLIYTLPSTGTYLLRVKAHDGPGVGGPAYQYVLRLFRDTSEPSVTLTFPLPGVNPSGPVTVLTATAADNAGGSGLSRVDFYYHPADWTLSAWTLIGSDAIGADGWQIPFHTGALADGSQISIYASAVDNAGNPGFSVNWNVRVDLTPPSLTLQPLAAETPNSVLSLDWTGSDSVTGIDHFTLQYQDNSGGWQDWPSPLPGSAHHAWFVGAFGHNYAFRLSATDGVGNTSALLETSTTVAADCQPDNFEAGSGDNTQSKATPIALAAIQQHNFCGTGDTDWVTFTAESGKTYFIYAMPDVGSAAAPVLSLYDDQGQAVPGTQTLPPGSFGLPGSIRWTAPDSGTYALRIQSLDPAAAGTDVSYTLGLTEDHPISLPLMQKMGSG